MLKEKRSFLDELMQNAPGRQNPPPDSIRARSFHREEIDRRPWSTVSEILRSLG
jgi:hypothetical protein